MPTAVTVEARRVQKEAGLKRLVLNHLASKFPENFLSAVRDGQFAPKDGSNPQSVAHAQTIALNQLTIHNKR